LVPAAFIGLWVIVVNWAINFLLSYFGLLPGAAAALSLGGNQGALYLLNKSFPVSLALSLGFARVTLPLTGAKLCFIASSASRFLFGK
jgi:hypothetical protein